MEMETEVRLADGEPCDIGGIPLSYYYWCIMAEEVYLIV